MGQLILLLIFLFAVSCVFYGIAAGVQGLQRGWNNLSNNCSDTKSIKIKKTSKDASASADLPIEEIETLFDLYQTGALTRVEYERCKQYFLSAILKS